MITPNAVGHVEWRSTDLERTKAFYGGLFGWEFRPFGEGYLLFKAPGYANGGFQKVADGGEVKAGESPSVYIETEDIEACLARAQELGGRVDTPRTEIPDTGWFAHLRDPDGNRVGLYQAKPKG